MAAVESLDVICICETWFGDTSSANIDGFSIFRADRVGRQGGGVAIYVRSAITASERSLSLPVAVQCDIDSVWCGLHVRDSRYLLGCIYRPPPSQSSSLSLLLQAANGLVESGEFHGLLICGDFNFSNITWHDGIASFSSGCKLSQQFIDTIKEQLLSQLVDLATYRHSEQQDSVLDLVLVDNQALVQDLCSSLPLGSAQRHHYSIKWSLCFRGCREKLFIRSRLCLAKGDYEGLMTSLDSVNWSSALVGDVDQAYQTFLRKYDDLCSRFIPLSPARPASAPPWLSDRIRRLCSRKKRLWHKLKASGRKASQLQLDYSAACKQLKITTRATVSAFERSIAEDKANPKRLFSYIKSRQPLDNGISQLAVGVALTSDKREIAEALNQRFKSVFIRDNDDALPPFPCRTSVCMPDVVFTESKVEEVLKSLHQHSAPGGDGVHAYKLGACAAAFARPIAILCSLSFSTGRLPSEWLEANVTPLHKKGSKQVAANYRPVSLTSVVCKVAERVFKCQLVRHLSSNELISKHQHGFVRGKACVTNLLETSDIITKALHSRRWLDIIFLDYATVFDSVSHRLLLHKLIAYGI